MTELALRMVASLAVVVGLLLLAARLAGRRFRSSTDAEIQVLQRQSISRGSQIAVVQVRDRVLVLGSTEQQVALLTSFDAVSAAAEDDHDGDHDGDRPLEDDAAPLADVVPLSLVPAAPSSDAQAFEALLAAAAAEAAEVAEPAQPVAPQPVPLPPGRTITTDPFGPRIPGRHRAPAPREGLADDAGAVTPAVPAPAPDLDPAVALLGELDGRAALMDLLLGAADAPLTTAAQTAAEATTTSKPAKPGRRERAEAKREAAILKRAQKILAAEQAAAPAPRATRTTTPRTTTPAPRTGTAPAASDDSRLAGSVLSPQTWRQAYQALTGRAS